jgi:hypothetical protein
MAPSQLNECTGPEMVLGKVRAYRSWNVSRNGVLRPIVASSVIWRRIPIGHDSWRKATCVNYFHPSRNPQIPMRGCVCGIYAWYMPNLMGLLFSKDGGPSVVGVIEAKGKILLGSTGIRAEQARIVALKVGFVFSILHHGIRKKIKANYPEAKIYRSLWWMILRNPPENGRWHLGKSKRRLISITPGFIIWLAVIAGVANDFILGFIGLGEWVSLSNMTIVSLSLGVALIPKIFEDLRR